MVVFSEIAVDRGQEVDQQMTDAASDAAARELEEEAFDRIEPGRRGRSLQLLPIPGSKPDPESQLCKRHRQWPPG
jgi:hypothetical protein